MKGLIYKELFLGKKTYIGFLALALGVAILGILVGLGIRYGNIQDIPAEEVAGFYQMFVYFTYALELLCFAESFWTVDRDRVSGWRRLEYTMPITNRKQMAARYVVAGIELFVCFLLGIVNAVVMSLLFRQTITGTMLKNLAVMLLVTMVLFLVGMPLYQRFSFQVITGILTSIAIALSIVFCFLMFNSAGVLEEWWNRMLKNAGGYRDSFLYLSPLIIPLLVVVSFTLSVMFYQRREK